MINISDSTVQPQVGWDQFKNVSNLVVVEPDQIRKSTYACIRLLFAENVENVAYVHLLCDGIRYFSRHIMSTYCPVNKNI